MASDLELEFHRVCELYFPDWDASEAWQVNASECNGYCDRQNKTILIGRVTENYSLPVLLVHEIAHAVTTDDHGGDWLDRMLEAQRQAEDFGEEKFANELGTHIAWVTSDDAYDVTDDEIYGEIVIAAGNHAGDSFEQIAGRVARHNGMTLETFLRAYPGSRENYDRGRETRTGRFQAGEARDSI